MCSSFIGLGKSTGKNESGLLQQYVKTTEQEFFIAEPAKCSFRKNQDF